MTLAGKHIIVTGASTGIGAAAALLLGQKGAHVSMIARSEDKLIALTRQINQMGAKATVCPADVTDRAALAKAFTLCKEMGGPADGLFANAGFGGTFAPFPAYSDENWDALIATNLSSVFLSIRHVIGDMIKRRRGSIVVTGSLAAERGMAMNAGYVAAKHGVLGLARAAALEGAPHGVRVNCLNPGFIDTPLMANIPEENRKDLASKIPQGRMGASEECAEMVAFLLSDAASHVTGQSIAVDGGILGTLSV